MKHIGNLNKPQGSTHKKKRIGRGEGSGYGGTSTRGHKGQKSRSGATIRIGFEGGQMPINRRVPKFGFNNIFKKEYNTINVGQIQTLIDNKKIDGSNINIEALVKAGALKKPRLPLKILGDGELSASITVEAVKATKSAIEKIESAGGSVKLDG